MPRPAHLFALTLITTTLACEDSSVTVCTTGVQRLCDCPSGGTGYSTCNENGTGYGECVCSTPSSPSTDTSSGGTDASAPDVTDSTEDAQVSEDSSEFEDAAELEDGDHTSEDVVDLVDTFGPEDTTVPTDDTEGLADVGEPEDTTIPEDDTAVAPATLVPLFDENTALDPPLQVDTPDALITRFSDRARDRHAREDQFQAYDHYLAFYWEHRTSSVEIIDPIGKGGDTITFNVTSQWKLATMQAELRFFYRGIGTVAEYFDNGSMTPIDDTHYTRSVSYNPKTGAPLAVGDRLEFELSHFLQAPPNGRSNYYGTAILYVVGQGIVPWEAKGVFGDFSTELEDSYPVPTEGWTGGGTTLHYGYSDEPDNHFMQMATNLSDIHGQVFVRGRRLHHTDVLDGSHNESVENPTMASLTNTLGPLYVNRSCVSCHTRNGRGLPAETGQSLDQYVVKIGTLDGEPDPTRGRVFQIGDAKGASEGTIVLQEWIENDGLRTPVYSFSGDAPEAFSARVAPALVGMGLLEAIPESIITALADPDDEDGDGISGRVRLVTDPETGDLRLGRFGYKGGSASVRHQVASALRTDMGVMTSVFPNPDCGPQQTCPSGGPEMTDLQLEDLSRYNSLLGIRPRRDLNDATTSAGETLFTSLGCADCHTPSVTTSAYHPRSELRSQTIWPYTDLLLHDMGPDLAATLPEGNASGAEWRTPPLWSVGLSAGVSGGESYLHDGRARTLDEAIRWHGGEGEAARNAYEALTEDEKASVIAFLKSI